MTQRRCGHPSPGVQPARSVSWSNTSGNTSHFPASRPAHENTEVTVWKRLPREAPPGFEPGMADLQSAALVHLATAPDATENAATQGQLFRSPSILRVTFHTVKSGTSRPNPTTGQGTPRR